MKNVFFILFLLLSAITFIAPVDAENLATRLSTGQSWTTNTPSIKITGDNTLELNCKIVTQPANGAYTVLLNKDNLVERSFGLYYVQDGGVYKILLFLFDSAGNYAQIGWNYTISTSLHPRISITTDISEPTATKCRLYINGVDKGNGDLKVGTCTSIKDGSAPIEIGARNGVLCGNVIIDDVRIFNYIRTPAEILANFQNELTNIEVGLLAYWKFNNDGIDSSIYKNNLTGVGNPSFTSDAPALVSDSTVVTPPVVTPSCPFNTIIGSDVANADYTGTGGPEVATLGLVSGSITACVKNVTDNSFITSLTFFDSTWTPTPNVAIRTGSVNGSLVIFVTAYNQSGTKKIIGKYLNGNEYCNRTLP